MTCYYPLDGYRSRTTTEKGKRQIVFDVNKGFADQPMQVPCGKCIGCRLDKSSDWAARCYHETKMHKRSCFLTLTYSDEELQKNGWGLHRRHLKNFRKRFKHYLKNTNQKDVLFFACGEYSPQKKRPHYHMIIFGYWPPDKKYYRKNKRGDKLYTSKTLDEIWGHGFVNFGTANEKTAGYVARYLVKKQYIGNNRSETKKVYQWMNLEEEFLSMTTQPPIGKSFWTKYRSEGKFKHDFMIINGRKHKPPRFYDKLEEQESEKAFRKVKALRIKGATREKWNATLDRLRVREEIKIQKVKMLARSND